SARAACASFRRRRTTPVPPAPSRRFRAPRRRFRESTGRFSCLSPALSRRFSTHPSQPAIDASLFAPCFGPQHVLFLQTGFVTRLPIGPEQTGHSAQQKRTDAA